MRHTKHDTSERKSRENPENPKHRKNILVALIAIIWGLSCLLSFSHGKKKAYDYVFNGRHVSTGLSISQGDEEIKEQVELSFLGNLYIFEGVLEHFEHGDKNKARQTMDRVAEVFQNLALELHQAHQSHRSDSF